MHHIIRVFACALLALAGLPASAQHHHGTTAQPAAHLYDNLGSHHRPVTTASTVAQQYFDQGLRLAYAFGRREAVASFREAQRHDPDCAMCYWGEAWALGPYINGSMDEAAGAEAHQAVQKATALRGPRHRSRAGMGAC